MNRMQRGAGVGRRWVLYFTAALVALLAAPDTGRAFPEYNDGGGTGCVSCHPGFTGGPGAALHNQHVNTLGPTTCNLCHPSGGGTKPVLTYHSGPGGGLGCAGCHGRDYGETSPLSGQPKSSAYGLRQHHANNGEASCNGCHVGGSLGHPNPLPTIFPENVLPIYYNALYSNLTDSCSSAQEDMAFDVDTVGLDNDGDGDADYPDDLDCPVPTPTPTFECPATPEAGCVAAGRGVLVISEKAAGKEKFKAVLSKLQASVDPSDYGDPVGGTTAYKLCVYDDQDALQGEYTVDQGGATCDGNPCFTTAGDKGFKYKDKLLTDDGVGKMNLFGGDAGKGKIVVVGKNKEGTMPTGAAAGLDGSTSATAQLLAEDAACFEAVLTDVKKNDGLLFKGVAK